jgi:histidinol-phosphatase (PHP family)
MRTNYHTHHGICGHAFGTAEMYIKEAIKNKVKILGFSDHSPSE